MQYNDIKYICVLQTTKSREQRLQRHKGFILKMESLTLDRNLSLNFLLHLCTVQERKIFIVLRNLDKSAM